jgi:hypothetical protein
MASLKCIATRLPDGSIKLTADGKWPELYEGEQLSVSLNLSREDSPGFKAAEEAKEAHEKSLKERMGNRSGGKSLRPRPATPVADTDSSETPES